MRLLPPLLPVAIMLAAGPAFGQGPDAIAPAEDLSESPRPVARPDGAGSDTPELRWGPADPADPAPDQFSLPDPAADPDDPAEPGPEPRPDPSAPPETASEPAAETLPEPEPSGPPAWQAFAEDDFSYQSCLLGLSMLGVSYQEVAPLRSDEDRDCGIARPLRIDAIQPGVALPGGPLMRCELARKLALWLRGEAQPAIRHLPGAPRIVAIRPGSTYQCRAQVGTAGDRLSEHALGNAFDIMAFDLSDGGVLPVQPREESGAIEEAVQKALRHGACLYFTTVLGPGSNAAHDDHLHFDIAAREGGWRLCE